MYLNLKLLSVYVFSYFPFGFEGRISLIPPAYEVYRGYIAFYFSVILCVCLFVCLFVCVCVNFFFFFVKDFSGITAHRILKFGSNVGYELLYCVKENQPPHAYHSLYLSIFLCLQ